MYPRGGACTVSVAYPTYGFAARKDITKVVSDGKINPIVFCENALHGGTVRSVGLILILSSRVHRHTTAVAARCRCLYVLFLSGTKRQGCVVEFVCN